MNYKLVAEVIFIGSSIGLGGIIFNKIPVLSALSEKEIKEGDKKPKLTERLRKIEFFRKLSYEKFLKKALTKVRILSLKTDNKTFQYKRSVFFQNKLSRFLYEPEQFALAIKAGKDKSSWSSQIPKCNPGGKYLFKGETLEGREMKKSTYAHGQDMKVTIADKAHAITKGLADFEIHDETYGGYFVARDVHVLLTTDHPKCGKEIGWVKEYGKSRVFYLLLGHDAKAWANPAYPALVKRGIQWAAKRD